MLRHLAYLAYVVTLLYASHMVNKIVPEPYMDEIMHVGQARAYCLGQWHTWDSRLTTPPGPYLISAGVSKLLASTNKRTLCDPPNLRRLNVAFMLVLPYILRNILAQLRHPIMRSSTRGKVTPSKLALQAADHDDETLEAIIIACFPLAAFFGLLYYTDIGSLAFVLLSFQQGLRQRWWTSSAVSSGHPRAQKSGLTPCPSTAWSSLSSVSSD
jgi:alpha-1,2-glucosyltransferase